LKVKGYRKREKKKENEDAPEIKIKTAARIGFPSAGFVAK
jgi:hypothetical protein